MAKLKSASFHHGCYFSHLYYSTLLSSYLIPRELLSGLKVSKEVLSHDTSRTPGGLPNTSHYLNSLIFFVCTYPKHCRSL